MKFTVELDYKYYSLTNTFVYMNKIVIMRIT